MHILIYNGKEQAFPHARFPILEPLSKNPVSPSVSSSPTADAMGLDSKQEFAGCGLDWSQVMQFTSPAPNQMKNDHQQQQQQRRRQPGLKCPRCESTNTKFCYYNNYNRLQPRHFCRTCRRHWTAGGTLRNVPVGGARKNKRTKTTHAATIDGANSDTVVPSSVSASLVSRGNFLDPFHSVSSLYDSAKLESVDEVAGIPITSGEWQLLPASGVGGGGAFEACVSGYWSCLDDDLNGFMAAVLNQ